MVELVELAHMKSTTNDNFKYIIAYKSTCLAGYEIISKDKKSLFALSVVECLLQRKNMYGEIIDSEMSSSSRKVRGWCFSINHFPQRLKDLKNMLQQHLIAIRNTLHLGRKRIADIEKALF